MTKMYLVIFADVVVGFDVIAGFNETELHLI